MHEKKGDERETGARIPAVTPGMTVLPVRPGSGRPNRYNKSCGRGDMKAGGQGSSVGGRRLTMAATLHETM